MAAVVEPITAPDDFGHSDRTQLALLATRVRPALGHRLTPLLGRGEVAVVHGFASGLRFPAAALPPAHAHTRLVLLGDLEVPLQEALRRHVAPGAVVWDVGANVGFFTLLAARLVTAGGASGRVLAFEPVPAVARQVAAAATRNGVADAVEVRAAALAASPGRAAFHVVADGSWSHLADRGAHERTAETIEVDVTTVDALVAAGSPPPDVLKVDVEGSEVAVLEGARETLRAHRPLVLCELHETNAEVCDLLDAEGYVATSLDGPTHPREAGPSRLIARPT